MKKMIKHKLNKKGFTLAELLIVVAIIAVLVAVAIPVFGSSLDNAKQAVVDANARAAQAQGTVEYLESQYSGTPLTTGEFTMQEGKNPVTYTWTYADKKVTVAVKSGGAGG